MSSLIARLEAAGHHLADDKLRIICRALVKHPPAAPQSETAWSYPSAERRFQEACMLAVNCNPRDWDGAREALTKAVWNDAELLRELFKPFLGQAVQLALTNAATALRKEMEPVAPGAGHQLPGNRVGGARPSNAGAAAVAAAARASILDTFRINGQAIGDVTPAEAAAWARSQRRDVRFVEALIANLPPTEPIRKWRKPEDAAALYAQAEAETND